jgi:hypothetical protein
VGIRARKQNSVARSRKGGSNALPVPNVRDRPDELKRRHSQGRRPEVSGRISRIAPADNRGPQGLIGRFVLTGVREDRGLHDL